MKATEAAAEAAAKDAAEAAEAAAAEDAAEAAEAAAAEDATKAAEAAAAAEKAKKQAKADSPPPLKLTAQELRSLQAEAKSMSLSKLNQLYARGHATNDVSRAGLLIHQHDNTENGWGQDATIYAPGGRAFFATSIVNRELPGLYNHECGIIVSPSAAKILCSYYADMMSWDAGCDRQGLADPYGWHVSLRPSHPRNTAYPPEGLVEMMRMSQELQEGKGKQGPPVNMTDSAEFARRGLGEPANKNFWLGSYNEVLISTSAYRSGMPWSVAGVFFVNGGDKDGRQCARSTLRSLQKNFGIKNTSHVLLLNHTPVIDRAAAARPWPGGPQAFAEWQPEY